MEFIFIKNLNKMIKQAHEELAKNPNIAPYIDNLKKALGELKKDKERQKDD